MEYREADSESSDIELLREQVKRLEEALSLAGAGTWSYELASGRILLSKEASALLGLPRNPTTISSQDWAALIHPDDRRKAQRAVLEAANLGQTWLTQFRVIVEGKVRVLDARGDGVRGPDGQTLRVGGMIRDITKQVESEQRYRAMFEQSAIARLLVQDEVVLDANDAAAELFGFESRTQLIARNLGSLFPGCQPDTQISLEKWRQCSHPPRTSRYAFFDFVIQRVDGRPVWVETHLTPMLIGDTNLQLIVFGDLTARREREESLRRNQERYELAVRGSTDGLWDWNVNTGETWFSPRFREIVGWTAEEDPASFAWVLGRVHPEDSKHLGDAIEEHLASWTRMVHGDGMESARIPPLDTEVRFERTDGTWRWFRVRGRAVLGVDGVPARLAGSVVDVTDWHEAQAKLRESEQRFRRLANIAPVMIWMTGTDGLCTWVNRQWIDFTGRSVEDELGNGWAEMVHPEDVERTLDTYVSSFHERQSFRLEFRMRRHNGDWRWLTHTGTPRFTDDNEFEGYVGSALDITDSRNVQETLREAARELEERNRELAQARDAALASARTKAAFLANVSHEIRTPMNGVIGMTELLLETELGKSQREYAETIRRSADSLLALLNDLLDLSKIEAGKFSLEIAQFSPRAVLEEVVDLMAPKATQKALELVADVAPNLPDSLMGDAGRLRQILLNLVGNALKFTEKGEVVVYAGTSQTSRTHAILTISVRDTGIGIPADRLESIFESFTQGDGTSTRRYGGTGLGLTICRQLSELMGGQLSVKSIVGRGSTFQLDIPLPLPAVARLGVTADKVSQKALRRLKGSTVVVADDASASRRALRAQLQAWGCRVLEAATVREANRLFLTDTRSSSVGLILVDESLVGHTGDEEDSYSSSGIGQRTVPHILLVAQGHRLDPTQLKEMGFQASLSKPVRQSALVEAIAKVFGDVDDTSIPIEESSTGVAHLLKKDYPLLGMRVLLAEDNQVNQLVAQKTLEKFGCSADAVENGRQAVERWKSGRYHVVLMDCQMPEMDGLEAAAEIRRLEALQPGLAPTTIIAVTAHAFDGERERCLAAGMDDYVAKPFKSQDLLQAILKRTRWSVTPS